MLDAVHIVPLRGVRWEGRIVGWRCAISYRSMSHGGNVDHRGWVTYGDVGVNPVLHPASTIKRANAVTGERTSALEDRSTTRTTIHGDDFYIRKG